MNGDKSSIELAGFPHHALDVYLPKLVRAGNRVAICEQLEDPKLKKKTVKRDIPKQEEKPKPEPPKPEPPAPSPAPKRGRTHTAIFITDNSTSIQ